MGIHPYRVSHGVVAAVVDAGKWRKYTRRYALIAMVNTSGKLASLANIVEARVRNSVIGATVPDMQNAKSAEELERQNATNVMAMGR